VTYAAVTARLLGRRPGILTRAAVDELAYCETPGLPENVVLPPGSELEGTAIHLLPSAVNTTFSNIYRDGRRIQIIEAWADAIVPSDLPAAWVNTPVVLLGPIAGELPTSWAEQFPSSILGVTPQGWMRTWDSAGHVSPTRWEGAERVLQRADVVVLSRDDAAGDDDYIEKLAALSRMLVVTDGWHPVTLYDTGVRYDVRGRPAQEVDPTGAGDVYAAAFLIRFAECGDPLTAAQFAAAMASMSVEGAGMSAIPERARVEEWLGRHG
jgi:hypothetical protein